MQEKNEAFISPSTNDGTTLIIGMPWPRTGTGNVMKSQISHQRSIGRKTVFVAVPRDPSHRRSNEIWQNFKRLSHEFGADKTIVATFDDRIRKGGKLGRWWSAKRQLNAMHWAMRAAAVSPIPEQLDQELSSGNVRLIIVNHVFASKFGIKIRNRLGELGHVVPMMLVTHDVQSHILLDNEIENPFTRKLDSFDELLVTELAALKCADVLVHVSYEDKLFFENNIPDMAHVLALPTFEDLSDLEHPFPKGSGKDFLFVGSNNVANYQALEWFFFSVIPWLGNTIPTLQIIGNVDELVKYRDDSLYERISSHVLGSVPETLPHYLMSKGVVIPMVSGRGVSMKTVEAAAIGKPIVGTRFAYRGLPIEAVKASGLMICDSPREFALAMHETLKHPAERARASRALFKLLFSFDQFGKSMDEAFETAVRVQLAKCSQS